MPHKQRKAAKPGKKSVVAKALPVNRSANVDIEKAENGFVVKSFGPDFDKRRMVIAKTEGAVRKAATKMIKEMLGDKTT